MEDTTSANQPSTTATPTMESAKVGELIFFLILGGRPLISLLIARRGNFG